jgi:hypothetical protein
MGFFGSALAFNWYDEGIKAIGPLQGPASSSTWCP